MAVNLELLNTPRTKTQCSQEQQAAVYSLNLQN